MCITQTIYQPKCQKLFKTWFKWAIFLYNYSGSEAGNVGGSMLPVSLPSINNPGHRYIASQQGYQYDS